MPLDNSLRILADASGGIPAFFGEQKIVILRKAVDVRDFVTRAEIEAALDCGLLRWPYFGLVHDGRRTPLTEITETRVVQGREVTGLADGRKVREHLARGATLKLNQLEDWHRRTREQQRGIESVLPVASKAFVFLTPEDRTGMPPHRDASHVLVVQLEGRKEWRLYDPGPVVREDAGLDVDTLTPPRVEVLEPGDVLYLPHAYPHAATAVGGWSLHVTFTLEEPKPAALARAARTSWQDADGFARLRATHQELTRGDKVRAVAASLHAQLSRGTGDDLVTEALSDMRARRPGQERPS
ncbi:JmjC domain-containing protein [Paractinoplanes lichenicola]|uniref:JmjC domain-containing protein n=1 Tax=Paractinoplanes lichenicola TaxID=2802976 RepID=A0ABS1VMR5_9ACTN|nr:cupin domain-containing protein [Actinoplanes lichenicola]MBL7256027.1 hypothetical protein [Actinoplanes lichenicola]